MGPYSSKLDDFEDFISHAKLSTLPLQLSHAPAAPVNGAMQRFVTGQSTASLGNKSVTTDRQSVSQTALQAGGAVRKLLLIEDMPHHTDLHQRQRLANLLGELVVLDCSYVIHTSWDVLSAFTIPVHAQPQCDAAISTCSIRS